MVFPFDEVAAELGPPFTGNSVLLHLLKMKRDQVASSLKPQLPAMIESLSIKPRNDSQGSANK